MSFIVVNQQDPIGDNCGHLHKTMKEAKKCRDRAATMGIVWDDKHNRDVPVLDQSVLDILTIFELNPGN